MIKRIKQYAKKIPFIYRLYKFLSLYLALSPIDADEQLNNFLDKLFYSKKKLFVLQIGANDGVTGDILRRYLKQSINYDAALIEPIKFYAKKLQSLYSSRQDIKILNLAAGSSNRRQNLFYIPPVIADQMNGDGPFNDWAHGQGSFDKNTVIHWIYENKFRGVEYQSRINEFISSIKKVSVDVIKTCNLIPKKKLALLVIDVQGAEFDVLRGINWKYPPKFIIIEDDLGRTEEFMNFFASKNYKFICGGANKLFERKPPYSLIRG
jgi:FkbM family methyltransferase